MRPPRRAAVRRATVAVAAILMSAACTACGGTSPSEPGQEAGGPTTVAAGSPTTGGPSPTGEPGFGPAVMLGRLTDEDITESSGLVASRREGGRLWTHNDSGNPPVLFCLEADGGPCGRWTVDGARNEDWEDIAAGPGPLPGEHYLYVGDIGDNGRGRDDIVIYRIIEPTVRSASDAVTAPATALRFRYDDGAHDAEGLMVHPGTGDIYVVTKAAGDTGVYKGPAGGGVLTRIATLRLGPSGLVTGADISPDGRRVALCTPFTGFELTLGGDDRSAFDGIWSTPPAAVALPARTQGEAIAYRLDGDALLLTSEDHPSPLFEVPRR